MESRTAAANMKIWIVDSDIGVSPDRAVGLGPPHQETLPWAWACPGRWPFSVLGPWTLAQHSCISFQRFET